MQIIPEARRTSFITLALAWLMVFNATFYIL
jgi:hypothetical protein